jgi:serine/threonine protein kinase HipA of HipAB toxin-antitoxin module
MTLRFNLSLVIFLALSLGAEGCARKPSAFPLDVQTIARLTSDNTGRISYVQSSDEILVTIVDKSGDSHVHRMTFAGMSRQRALEMLRRKQEELEPAGQPSAD